jgi:uncharacterized protein YkwD
MLDSLVLALSVAVASSHLEARDITSPESIAFSAAPAIVRQSDAMNMLVQLNTMRSSAGLSSLTEDPALSHIALEHAEEMAHENYFGHESPQGETLEQRFAQHNMHAILIGENLAWCTDLREAAVDLWQSPAHQTNELDARFHHIGLAALQTGDQGTLYVQLFTE